MNKSTMLNFIKMFGVTLIAVCLFGTKSFAIPVSECSNEDFWVGEAGTPTYSNDCTLGATANDSTTDVNNQAIAGHSDWTLAGKSDSEGGLFDVMVTAIVESGEIKYFSWSITGDLAPGTEALFVVKQSTPDSRGNTGGWVAYHFDPLTGKAGGFDTEGSFYVDDFSHLSVYVRESDVTKVPEINAGGLGIALALLFGLAALFRERRVF